MVEDGDERDVWCCGLGGGGYMVGQWSGGVVEEEVMVLGMAGCSEVVDGGGGGIMRWLWSRGWNGDVVEGGESGSGRSKKGWNSFTWAWSVDGGVECESLE